jgi:hypothetical protein
MTGEHIPPRRTGNVDPVGLVLDPLDINSVVQQVADWNEGHVVSTLCLDCNGRASRWGYVGEYRRWFDDFVAHRKAVVAKTGADSLRARKPLEIDLPYNVQPARFVRQVLGMFLAVQEAEHLFVEYPVLPELIGPDPSGDSRRRADGLDISPLHLYLSVYNGKWGYGTCPMASIRMSFGPASELLWTPPSSSSELDDFLILCLTPFAFVLTTAEARDLGHDISSWTRWTVGQRPDKSERPLTLLTVDQLQGGIRAMIYPDDYIVR